MLLVLADLEVIGHLKNDTTDDETTKINSDIYHFDKFFCL